MSQRKTQISEILKGYQLLTLKMRGRAVLINNVDYNSHKIRDRRNVWVEADGVPQPACLICLNPHVD